MKILVLGAGVIGVTTAYELAADGHAVTVIERHARPARETSFANAGLIAPGHSFAWASPKVPGILLKSLFRNDQAFRLRFNIDHQYWRWALRFLGQCTAERARRNTLRKHRLCRYSQHQLHRVIADTRVRHAGTSGGLLYLYRSSSSLERGIAHMQLLADAGQPQEVLDRDQIAELDPAYSDTKAQLAGGVYCPTDESGDSHRFTTALAAVCAERGVGFEYGATITHLDANGDRIRGVNTDRGAFTADAFVVALGPYSAPLVQSLNIYLPIYPVKGYSVSVACGDRAPRLGAVDEDHLIAYARLGERFRVTAIAEFAGYDTSFKPQDFVAMLATVRELLPGASDYTHPEYWSCLRPMTPQGTPIFGRARFRNLYLNTGHGHMGWTMACGSARITADLIHQRKPQIDLEGMLFPV